MSVPVRVLDEDGPRWDPSELEEYLVGDAVPRPAATGSVGALKLAPEAAPPMRKLGALLAADDLFRRTWERKRRDLPSQSEYDLALANVAVLAGWSDQEIVDLLIAHRVMHGEEPKLRPDYYARTIAAARGSDQERRATELLADHASSNGGDEVSADDLRTAVSAKLGLDVLRISRIRPAMGDPVFRLDCDGGAIQLTGADVASPSRFRAKALAVVGHVVRRYREEQWLPIAQALMDIVEEADLGEEETVNGRVAGWLRGYLADRSVSPEEEWAEALEVGAPYWHLGAVWVSGPDLRRWARARDGDLITSQQMGTLLRAAGSAPATHVTRGTCRYVWQVPAAVLEGLLSPSSKAAFKNENDFHRL